MSPHLDTRQLRNGFGLCATGVTIVSYETNGERHGIGAPRLQRVLGQSRYALARLIGVREGLPEAGPSPDRSARSGEKSAEIFPCRRHEICHLEGNQ